MPNPNLARLVFLLGALMLLWGCNSDKDGPRNVDVEAPLSNDGGLPVPAHCESIDPKLAKADADELFKWPTVPVFDFYLPSADWKLLQKNARDEEYVEADLCFEDQYVGRVGLRFKGYYSSLCNCFNDQDEMICPRLSMKVKFSEYHTEQMLLGLKRLNFHAYCYDESRMQERLTFDLFRAMGIVAPRTSWAVIRVNDETQGQYGMIEQVDGRFTADRCPDHPNGNLYKEV